jgi:hypothetical protein
MINLLQCICAVLLFTKASAFLHPTAHPLFKNIRVGTVCERRKCMVPHMSADSPAKETQSALFLKRELEEELPQLFDLKYTPKWNLYAEEVRNEPVRIPDSPFTSFPRAAG